MIGIGKGGQQVDQSGYGLGDQICDRQGVELRARRRGDEVLERWALALHGPARRGSGAGTFTSTV